MPKPDINVLLAVIFGLIVLYMVAKIMFTPARMVLRLLVSACIGGIAVFIFNLVGNFFGLVIGINFVTAMLVGYMGLPGLVMLVLLQRMLGS